MGATTNINFGLLIAFFCPGFVTLLALGHVSTEVTRVLDSLLLKDQALGASFLVLVSSIVLGVITSGAREVTLDGLHFLTGVPTAKYDYSKLSEQGKLEAFREALDNTYRYYQFYGNTLIALVFLLITRYFLSEARICGELPLFVISLLAVVILFVRSRRSLADTHDEISQVLGIVPIGGGSDGKAS